MKTFKFNFSVQAISIIFKAMVELINLNFIPPSPSPLILMATFYKTLVPIEVLLSSVESILNPGFRKP